MATWKWLIYILGDFDSYSHSLLYLGSIQREKFHIDWEWISDYVYKFEIIFNFWIRVNSINDRLYSYKF